MELADSLAISGFEYRLTQPADSQPPAGPVGQLLSSEADRLTVEGGPCLAEVQHARML